MSHEEFAQKINGLLASGIITNYEELGNAFRESGYLVRDIRYNFGESSLSSEACFIRNDVIWENP